MTASFEGEGRTWLRSRSATEQLEPAPDQDLPRASRPTDRIGPDGSGSAG